MGLIGHVTNFVVSSYGVAFKFEKLEFQKSDLSVQKHHCHIIKSIIYYINQPNMSQSQQFKITPSGIEKSNDDLSSLSSSFNDKKRKRVSENSISKSTQIAQQIDEYSATQLNKWLEHSKLRTSTCVRKLVNKFKKADGKSLSKRPLIERTIVITTYLL